MNSKKIKYFLFPKPSLNHLLFLFYFISSILKQALLKDIKGKDNLSIPIFKLYVYNIGDLLSSIPLLLRKKKTITKSKDNNELKHIKSTEEIKYIYLDEIGGKKYKKRVILNLFGISIFDFIAQISTVTYYLIKQKQNFEVKHANLNSLLVFNVIFLFLFSRLILKTIFYRHHYFSFVIFIICLMVIALMDFLEIKDESKEKFILSIIYLSVKIFATFLYSLEDVIAKPMFLYYYFSPYSLLLYKALIQIIYLIIFSLPLCLVKFKDEKGEEMIIFSMFGGIFENKLYILLYIIYMFNSLFYNILNFMIIDVFSPNHTAIAKIFEYLGIFLINIIQGDITSAYNIAIRFIMYIILIITSFIYNEFLVINICGLSNDTKLFLEYKERYDLLLVEDTHDSEDLSRINSDISSNSDDHAELDEIND